MATTTNEPTTAIERIAHAYAGLCLSAFADDGWDTIRTLRWYQDGPRGLGYQMPSASPGEGNYIQVSEVYLSESDLLAVAARIDQAIAAGEV